MTVLSVNMNVPALLRNRRGHPWPNIIGLARTALQNGAFGLTLHPRPDERHATADDARVFKALIQEEFPDRELNVEGYPDDRFLALVKEVNPDQVTLVPDAPDQATSDHGWDFRTHSSFLTDLVSDLKTPDRRVALFADPDADQMEHAAATGADRVELYTCAYGSSYDDASQTERELDRLAATTAAALDWGLGVNAGHDLTVPGTRKLVERVPEIAEVSIGHALFCDTLMHGINETVRRYVSACQASSGDRP
jgi:pyridoxine 5-phosphate synthase